MKQEELDKLTPEQKRKTIAIICGWHGCKFEDGRYIGMYGPTRGYQKVPDYLNDLNAMHEATETLSLSDLSRYYIKLSIIVSNRMLDTYLPLFVVNAPASERADAFLLCN